MKQQTSIFGVTLLVAAVLAAGCRDERTSATAPGASATTSRQGSNSRTETMVIPSGTDIVASLDSQLITDSNHTGDHFLASTASPVIVDGKTVIPAGARIHGVLQDVQNSGRVKGRARITLAFEQIEDAAGKTHSISAQPLTIQAASEARGDIEKIAAGGVLGAIVGGIADEKKGAAIGGGAGVAAGTILMLASKGDELELNPGQRLNVHTLSPTNISVTSQK